MPRNLTTPLNNKSPDLRLVGQDRAPGGQPATHPQPAEEARGVGQELSVLAGRPLGLAGDAAHGRALRRNAQVHAVWFIRDAL